MITINYTIKTLSDAQIGSGFGSELINSLVPRDANNHIIIPAAHLKGIFRDTINKYFTDFLSDIELDDEICGCSGAQDIEDESLVKFSDAVAKSAKTRSITRSSLNDFGTAEESSLRTEEVVAANTIFNGKIYISKNDPILIDFVKTICLSIDKLGGNRQRGSGNVLFKITNESKMPGDLLPDLTEIKKMSYNSPANSNAEKEAFNDSEKYTWLKVSFIADGNICCPDRPVIGCNTIVSGLGIPASAVQGALLTKINSYNKQMADTLFQSNSFRVWPLYPIGLNNCSDDVLAARVSMSYQVSKNKLEGKYLFRDKIMDAYDWTKVPPNAALKGTDGIIRFSNDKNELWKENSIPKMISIHCGNIGALSADETVFTVESLAPMTFNAIMTVPENTVEKIMEIFKNDNYIAFGKARSIRGGGLISIKKIDIDNYIKEDSKIFILQSPVLLNNSSANTNIYDAFSKIIEDSGWDKPEICFADTEILFGWNRNKLGQCVDQTGRLKAERVIKPGSVFKLKTPPENLFDLIQKGIGKGKERGFGAVLPHPGLAYSLYEPKLPNTKIASKDIAGILAYNLYVKVKDNGPSASQIAALMSKIDILNNNTKQAMDFLKHIKEDRPLRFWKPWVNIETDLIEILEKHKTLAVKTLKYWQDLTILNKGNK